MRSKALSRALAALATTSALAVIPQAVRSQPNSSSSAAHPQKIGDYPGAGSYEGWLKLYKNAQSLIDSGDYSGSIDVFNKMNPNDINTSSLKRLLPQGFPAGENAIFTDDLAERLSAP